MLNLFQQRDFGTKINATFQYITQNFRSLGLALLYIVGPLALLTGIASGIVQSNMLATIGSATAQTDPSDPLAGLRMLQNIFSPAYWVALFFGLITALAVNLVTYAHMKLYAEKNGADSTVGEIWEATQPLIGRGLIITVLGTIITVVAMFFFLIPGIYVAVVLSLSLAVTTFEGTDFSQTWNRCFKLIRDKWWSTFGLLIIVAIISAILGLIFNIPAGVVGFLAAAKLLPSASTFWLVLTTIISSVGGTMLRAMICVALAFQYTNLVERQEGRGLISAIDSIGTTPTKPRLDDEGEY
ncbi:MAG: hypothetical protein H7319_14270 [Spirosoma sp.]|nr:hypothetical protein [Spirosoma sp.]